MKIKNLFLSLMYLAVACFALSSCEDNEDNNASKPNQADIFILNEGKINSNNACLSAYMSDSNKVYGNYFEKLNNQKMGDVGQDMILSGNYIYIAMSSSKTIYKLDKEGYLKSSCRTEDKPRALAVKDGKLYVSCYGGKVLRINAQTLEIEKSIKLSDSNLEGISICNNKLYVANSYSLNNNTYVYHNNLFTINLSSFAQDSTLEIGLNPNILTTLNNQIYAICHGNWGDIKSSLVCLNTANNSIKKITTASRMAVYNDKVYLAYSDYGNPTNAFDVYNTKTGELEGNFLKNAPAELSSGTVYMIAINPYNGEIYIATSDYQNNGDIYRFKNDGTYVTKFDSEGVSPSKAVFFK